jgi:hypothetical protein
MLAIDREKDGMRVDLARLLDHRLSRRINLEAMQSKIEEVQTGDRTMTQEARRSNHGKSIGGSDSVGMDMQVANKEVAICESVGQSVG